jgi:hypothetical protein
MPPTTMANTGTLNRVNSSMAKSSNSAGNNWRPGTVKLSGVGRREGAAGRASGGDTGYYAAMATLVASAQVVKT